MLVVLCLAFSGSLYGRYKAKVRQQLLEELREMNAIVEAELKEKEEQFKELEEQSKVIQKCFSTREGYCLSQMRRQLERLRRTKKRENNGWENNLTDVNSLRESSASFAERKATMT